MLVIGFAILIALAARATAADFADGETGDEAGDEIATDRESAEPGEAVVGTFESGDLDIDERALAAADTIGDAFDDDWLGASEALAHGDARVSELAQPRPSPWGRFEVAVAWRHRADDLPGMDKQRDEVWLLAVWSR